MQVSTTFQCDERIVVKPEEASQTHGIVGEACAVVSSIGITRFNTKRERKDDGFGIIEFVGEVLQPQQGAYTGEELLGIERLAEKIVCAGLDAAKAVVAATEDGD